MPDENLDIGNPPSPDVMIRGWLVAALFGAAVACLIVLMGSATARITILMWE